MLKEIFHDSYKISKFTRICMETYSSVTGWQKLFFSYKSFCFSAAVAMATFAIHGWKFTGYLILICFYSSCYFSKPNCFCVYRKSLFNVPTNSHGVWAACASTIKKKEERKYWQMSINSAYRVNAFSQFSQVLPTLGIRKCTNIYEFQFLNCKIYCRLKRTETDLINHKGYFPKRYKTNWLIFELNETPLPRKRVSKSEMH